MQQRTAILTVFILLLFAGCGQKQMKTPQGALPKLEEFRGKEKFIADNRLFYPGIADPALKPLLTEKINLAADDFMRIADKSNPTKKDYQNVIGLGLSRFAGIYIQLDTEDRERVCSYFEELMDIVGLESSDGQLNTFMYGFDPGGR